MEELQLESPYKDMDAKQLKSKVGQLLSSGEEFVNTNTWQVGSWAVACDCIGWVACGWWSGVSEYASCMLQA